MQKITSRIISIIGLYLLTVSCNDFVKIDPPRTSIVKAAVFESEDTANAAMLDVYYSLKTTGFSSGTASSISFLTSLTTDEEVNYVLSTPVTMAEFQQFNDNSLRANNQLIGTLWSELYQVIYKANAIVEGLEASEKILLPKKEQLQGEARFVRAFCLFYLVNLWGDIPMPLTTDYRINERLARAGKAEIYQQIIDDLKFAQQALPSDYSLANNERVRATKWAAKALLARVYLFTENWSKAHTEATAIIDNTSLFSLRTNLADVFTINNSEAILQWWSSTRPPERATFRFTSTPSNGALRPEYADAFEVNDLRKKSWLTKTSAGYYSVNKYSLAATNPPAEYSTIIRLAEIFLIRAEARIQLNDFTGAQADINKIRSRAGLTNTIASDKTALLNAVIMERKSELFCEWGHRWLDLKRSNRADEVLKKIKPDWTTNDLLYPLPESELINNSALSGQQNPGY